MSNAESQNASKPLVTFVTPQDASLAKHPSVKLNHASLVHKRGSNTLTVKLLLSFAIPVYLETLDYTVVAPSQTRIASAFNHLDYLSLLGSIYHLAVTIFLPLFVSFADIYGRHRALQAALVLVFLGSDISTFSFNIETMLVGRGITGMGIAGLLTVIRIITSDSASLNPAHWQAYVLVLLSAVAFSTGPIIGAAIVSVSFRWIFAINLPSSVIAMGIVYLLISKIAKGPQPHPQNNSCECDKGEHAKNKFLRVDWISAICWIVGGVLILLGLNWGANGRFSQPRVIASISIGSCTVFLSLLWQFVIEHMQNNHYVLTSLGAQDVEKSEKEIQHVCPHSVLRADPIIPLFVLKSYDTWVTQFAAFTTGMAFTVTPYFLAVFFSIAVGMAPADMGLRLIHFSPAMSVGMIVAILMVRFFHQPKWPILIGSTLIPLSLGLINWSIANVKHGVLNVFMVTSGLGVGMTFGPLAAQAPSPKRKARVPIVILNLFFRSLGATVGLAQSFSILNHKVNKTLSANGVPLSTATLFSTDQIGNLPTDTQSLVRSAYSNGIQWAFVALLPWCGISLVLSLFLSLKPPPLPPKELRRIATLSRRKTVLTRRKSELLQRQKSMLPPKVVDKGEDGDGDGDLDGDLEKQAEENTVQHRHPTSLIPGLFSESSVTLAGDEHDTTSIDKLLEDIDKLLEENRFEEDDELEEREYDDEDDESYYVEFEEDDMSGHQGHMKNVVMLA